MIRLSLLVALAISCADVGAASEPSVPSPAISIHQQQAQPGSSEANSTNEKRGTKDSPIFVEKLDTEGDKKEKEQIAKDRDEHASNEMWLVRGTIALAILTAFLAAFTISLAKSTRRMALGAEDTARRQLRAYVHVHTKQIGNVKVGEKPKVELVLRNSGQTPALNVRTWCRLYLLNLPLDSPPDFPFEIIGEGSRSIIPPNGEICIGSQEDFAALTIDDLICIGFFNMKRFWISGRVLYDDVFGNSCQTTFRFHSMEGPYPEDGDQMNLRWSRYGNKTEQSRPDDDEDNDQPLK